jgi:hypothetical protein
MASLPRDTVAKACRRFRQRIEAVVDAGGDFLKNLIQHNPLNITCTFHLNIFIKNVFIAFLLKSCKEGGFTDPTLYMIFVGHFEIFGK